jgi:M6 family metalloprotease-like protein
MHIMVHEVGHWLLGAAHPYGGGPPGYSFWAMMGAPWPHGMCANSFERERLAWIDVDSIDATFTANLSDFITTGDAYKYHPPNGDANEFYYFENHQKLSIYDDATTNGNDKGVWILHHRNPYNNTQALRIKPSFGYWN